MSRHRQRIKRTLWVLSAVGLAAGTFLYHWLLRPATVEQFLIDQVAAQTRARLSLKVAYASPLFGLRCTDVNLRTADGDVPILTAGEVRLRFFLPALFAGHIGIRELGLDQATLSLVETAPGVFNTDALTGPPAPEPTEPAAPLPEEVNLYLPLKLFAYLNLRDFNFILKTGTQDLAVRNIDLRAGFVTGTTSRLPLSYSLLEILEALAIQVGGERPIELAYRTNAGSVAGPIDLNLFLHRDRDLSEADLSSRLRLGTDRLLLSGSRGTSAPLGLAVAYRVDYDAPGDRVSVPEFTVKLREDPWLNLKGEIAGATTRERTLKLTLGPSLIRLDSLHQVLQGIPGLSAPDLAGEIQLAGLSAEGPLEKLAVSGKLSARGLRFARTYHFPEVRADLAGALDLYPLLAFLEPPANYDSKRKLAFGLIHWLRTPDLFAIFNGGRIQADASILPETGIKAKVNLEQFPLEFFTGPALSGRLSAEIDFLSTESFETLTINGIARLDGARYVIERSRSAAQNARTNLKGRIRLAEEGVFLDFEDLDLTVRDLAGDSILHLLGALNMRFDRGQFYGIDARRLSIDYARLRPTLPGIVQYWLAPARQYLSRGLELTTKLDLSFYETSTVTGGALLKVPYLNVDDLKVDADLAFAPGLVAFRRLELTGLRGALRSRVQGEMRTDAKGLWRPRLDAALDLARDARTRIHPNLTMRGRIHFEVNAAPDTTRGDLVAENFDLTYNGDSNQAGGRPLEFDIQGVQLKLPFQHDIHIAHPRRLNERAGELFVRNYGFFRTPNLRVERIAASHNPRGEYKKDRYYYLGDRERTGLKARLVYEKNVLYLPWLEALVNHGRSGQVAGGTGLINGRNMYFNLANLSAAEMEYGADVQIQDLDLEPYLPFSRSSYDGRVSADLRLRGRNLDEPLRTMNARLAVYKLSPEFSGFATRLVMPERLIAGLVNNTLSIPSIRVELNEGLVYSSVTMSRGGLGGVLVRPAREELKQERVPLAQFTARSREVVNEFGERGPPQ